MKKLQEDYKKPNGITLVALVITVVVMLILAGVAIAAVVDGDGLFSKTRQVAETYENAADREGHMLENLMGQIDHYIQDSGNGDVVEPGEDGDDPVVDPPSGGATIGEVVNENKTFSGGTKGSYSDPIIPKGFAPVNEGNATWGSADGYQKGLVIQDASGNQFVWVPVDGTNVTFARQDFGFYANGDFEDYSDPETQELTNITNSVTTNGGFYIARYEAGLPDGKSSSSVAIDGTDRPVSQQGATVWNNIAWSENGTNDDENPGDGAVTVARNMYPDTPDSEYGAVSTLIYGTQWDTALKFIGVYGGDTTYAIDSTGKGNYNGTTNDPISGLGTCGADPSFSQKNIYDMAGNVDEWTMEKYSTYRVGRGGYYDVSGSDLPASNRYGDGVGNGNTGIRFPCCALYKAGLSPKEKRSN